MIYTNSIKRIRDKRQRMNQAYLLYSNIAIDILKYINENALKIEKNERRMFENE